MKSADARRGAENVHIHIATLAEAPLVTDVLRESFREFAAVLTTETFAVIVATPDRVSDRMREGPVWLATIGGNAVGTLSAVGSGESYYLRGMAVLPSARGHGVGEALLQSAEAFARIRGAAMLTLATRSFQLAAIRLYERFGFTFTESEDAPFGTKRLLMEKSLRSG